MSRDKRAPVIPCDTRPHGTSHVSKPARAWPGRSHSKHHRLSARRRRTVESPSTNDPWDHGRCCLRPRSSRLRSADTYNLLASDLVNADVRPTLSGLLLRANSSSQPRRAQTAATPRVPSALERPHSALVADEDRQPRGRRPCGPPRPTVSFQSSIDSVAIESAAFTPAAACWPSGERLALPGCGLVLRRL
jgi:hypothetical protein